MTRDADRPARPAQWLAAALDELHALADARPPCRRAARVLRQMLRASERAHLPRPHLQTVGPRVVACTFRQGARNLCVRAHSRGATVVRWADGEPYDAVAYSGGGWHEDWRRALGWLCPGENSEPVETTAARWARP